MTNCSPTFIDTNILVYANLAQSPFHAQAVERLQTLNEQGAELWINRQVLREYLSAMTRQSVLTAEIPISSLIDDIRYFSNCFRIAEDSPLVTERLLTLPEQIPTGGKQVHDANIVATMQVHGIHYLLTHNVSDFERFSEIITILPLET